MNKKATFVGVIGHIEPDWIAKQMRLEDNIAFAKSVHYVPSAQTTPHKFAVTDTIKQAFASSFHFISSIPKL